ncbi:MAG: VOC family protein [Woeseiaceae bacterium]|nr:VOC family protein [Woeseiaceae bacterium]
MGPIIQNGFVVRDWREAALHWAETLGVGPFFAIEHVEFAECFFRGEPVDIDMSVAIAYTGGYQIELVQQHNDAPSIYTEFLEHNEPGLQHVGTLVDDLDQAIAEGGFEGKLIQHGTTAAGQRFAYVDSILHNGTMLELIEADGGMRNAFDYMQKAAVGWDGTDPIRV